MSKLIRDCLWMIIVVSIMIAIQMLFAPGAHSCDKVTGWPNIEWGTDAEDIKSKLVPIKHTTHEIDGKKVKIDSYHVVGFEAEEDKMGQPILIFLNGKYALAFAAMYDGEFLGEIAQALENECGVPGERKGEGILWLGKSTVAYASFYPDEMGLLMGSTSGFVLFAFLIGSMDMEELMDQNKSL